MLGLSSPLWLGALATLAIPIGLHLWSRRPTRIVRVGSLRHLDAPRGPRAWGRRLDDIPLLLLRCGVLIAVGLGLAGLTWDRAEHRSAAFDPLFLIEPALLADSLTLYQDPLIDSLRRRGVPLRVLTTGAPEIAGYDPSREAASDPSTWARLGELDVALPRGTSLVVIGRARAASLGAIRPSLSRPIRWYELASDSGARRVVASWAGTGDSTVRQIETRNGLTVRQFLDTQPGGGRPPLLPGPFVVVGDPASFETRAVRAAFAAATAGLFGLAPEIELRTSDRPVDPARKPAWIVWLDRSPLPASVSAALSGGASLLEFPPPTPAASRESGVFAVGTTSISPGLSALTIHRRTAGLDGVPVLVDDQGDPVLTVARAGRGLHFRMAIRPDPAWGDLALGAALPELAAFLLRHGADPADQAPISAAQATPSLSTMAAPAASGPIWSLRNALLWLAAGLLLGERLLAHRRRNPA